MEITTTSGTARAQLDGDIVTPRFLLVLTHGAGGTVEAPDLLAVRGAALRLGGMVARVTQPYRVSGARAPGSAARQDAAWVEIVAAVRQRCGGVPLAQGGRSNGARVACRTATAVGARAVLALAFPLRPPRRSPAAQASGAAGAPGAAAAAAAPARLAELQAARAGGAKVLVINGDRDPFGIPDAQDADRVVIVPGETHALRGHRTAIAAAVAGWLPGLLLPGRPETRAEETAGAGERVVRQTRHPGCSARCLRSGIRPPGPARRARGRLPPPGGPARRRR